MNQRLRISLGFLCSAIAILLIGAGISAWMSQRGIWVDPSGSDSSGSRNHQDRPFRTIGAAKTNAQDGDTIFVNPGNYTNNNLLKAGVNYQFYPGAKVYYTETNTSGSGFGIFDDRGSGPTTNIISGAGSFTYTITGAGTGNELGLFVTTNSTSNIRIEGKDFSINIPNTVQNATAVFNVINASYVDVSVDRMIDLNVASAAAMGVFWIYGDVYFHARQISNFGQWGIWAEEVVTTFGPGGLYPAIVQPQIVNASYNLWCTWDDSAAPNYISEVSTNMRVWVDCKRIETTSNMAFEIDGAGKHYIRAEKIQALTGIQLAGSVANPPDLQVWITVQKLSATSCWLNLLDGTLTADIGQFEDLGIGANDGIHVAASTGDFRIRGQRLKMKAGSTAKAVNFTTAGSKLLLEDMTLDSTNSSTATITVAAAGVTLKNVAIVSSTDSITAATAKTVNVYGTSVANRAKNANITIGTSGTLTVDVNVQ